MSASGTPTAATARLVMEARIVNKVRSVCVSVCFFPPVIKNDISLSLSLDRVKKCFFAFPCAFICRCVSGQMCLYLHAPERTLECVYLQ